MRHSSAVCRKGLTAGLSGFGGGGTVDFDLFGVADAALVIHTRFGGAVNGHLAVGGAVRAETVLGAAAEIGAERGATRIRASLGVVAADADLRATAKPVLITGTVGDIAF